MTQEAITQDELTRGIYIIKCIKQGGLVLTTYGQYSFEENEVLDLLHPDVPDTLKAADYWVAHNMCVDPGFELAQHILADNLQVIKTVPPIVFNKL